MIPTPDDARTVDSPPDMAEWKRVVAETVSAGSEAALRLCFFGGANQITGYRLYYMLQYAKRAGVRRLSLQTDGLFWIDEATDWLIESGVDDIVLMAENGLPPPLARQVDTLRARGPRVPTVTIEARAAHQHR